MRFSDRIGVTKPRQIEQLNSLDAATRSRLWNVVNAFLDMNPNAGWGDVENQGKYSLICHCYDELWKLPTTDVGAPWQVLEGLQSRLNKEEWFEVLNFIEFLARSGSHRVRRLVDGTNRVFESERVGYRFVDERLVQITNEVEIAEIELAVDASPPTVRSHLDAAIGELANRESTDFRNCVKESILAVEAAARLVTGKPNATLGDALPVLERDHALHPALKDAWSKLYGYSSDSSGIRHAAKLDDRPVDLATARYFVVSCSAFANYLLSSKPN